MKKIIIKLLLFVFGFCYSINPKVAYIATPKTYKISYKTIVLKRKSIKINVWISYASQNLNKKIEQKTVFLVYGDFGNMSYFLSYIAFFTKRGYNVISFDYRGFGASSKFKIDKNQLFYYEFADDLKYTFNYFKNKVGINNMTIMSLSMGTIISAVALQNQHIHNQIVEGCVFDYQYIATRLFKIKNKIIKLPKNKVDLPKIWNSITGKILILVGSEDEITNEDDALQIVNQNVNKRKLFVYNGQHLGILFTNENEEAFDKIIKENL